jgi:type IV pilus assembly protein PilC
VKFTYTAVKSDGTTETDTRDVADRYALARELRARGLTPVKVEEVAGQARSKFFNLFRRRGGKVKMKTLLVFAGSLSSMLGAGLSLARALLVIERQTTDKRFKIILTDLVNKISAGGSLSQAMANFPNVFPPVFISMTAAGEESGNLPGSLEIVRQQLAKSYDLRRKIRGALIYPSVILSVIVVIAILMMIFVVPTITAVFKDFNVELPVSTRLLIASSNLAAGHPVFVFGLLFALVFGAWRVYKSVPGQRVSTRLFMRLPLIGPTMRNLNSAVTMRTLSSLISSGVGMLEALRITGAVLQNHLYKSVLAQAETRVEKGAPLSGLFKENDKLFPVLVGEVTEVGEETGNLAGMLLKGATFFEDEVEQATKNISTFIEPALMILIGIAVGLFAVSVLGPIYSLSNSI